MSSVTVIHLIPFPFLSIRTENERRRVFAVMDGPSTMSNYVLAKLRDSLVQVSGSGF